MSRFEKLSQENNKPKAEASEEIFMTKSEIEALREEAEQIERELEEDPFIDSMDPPKELYNRIVQELKDKGIYHEDEEDVNEEKEEVVEEKKKVVFYSRWKRAGKCAAIVCLILSGVFGVAMTSEANRVYLLKQVEFLLGDDAQLNIDNNEQRKKNTGDLVSAVQSIETELGVEVPDFLYLPKNMRYLSYDLDMEGKMAFIQYEYMHQLLTLYISNNQNDTSELSTYDAKHIVTQSIYKGTIEVDIWELKDSSSDDICYTAQWNYKNCYYELSGKISKEEFLKIINKIEF